MDFSRNRGLAFSNLFWVGAVLAAVIAGALNGLSLGTILPYASIALLPALCGLALWPFADREWAQVLVILLWTSLAIIACFAIAFVPMAILFLCAPLAAALFEREKVIEAMVLSAIFAAVVFYLGQFGYAPEPLGANENASGMGAHGAYIGWAQLTGIGATIAFMIGAMYFASSADHISVDEDMAQKMEFANAYPGAALKFTNDGILVSATDKALSAFGLSERDYGIVSLENLGLADEGTDLDQAFAQVLAQNNPLSGLSVSTMSSGDEGVKHYYDLELVPQMDGNVYAFATDRSAMVVKLQQLQEAQLSADKHSAEKTLFFAGVSHELRTPLNAIIGFSDMMRSRLFGPLPGKYADYANLIHDSGQHMLDLIGDVLDMSKVEAGKYELDYDKFDVADVIRSSLKMVRPSADAAALTLAVDIDVNSDLLIEADRRAVRQILLNLLSNAIKFTPKGGRILVSAKIVDNIANISVEDNGTGMSRQDLDKIGTAYTQAENARVIDARGSGLGLALVKNLVELHKGRMTMNSHPGTGTSANIYLPTQKPEV